jgi:hypothetical protein
VPVPVPVIVGMVLGLMRLRAMSMVVRVSMVVPVFVVFHAELATQVGQRPCRVRSWRCTS